MTSRTLADRYSKAVFSGDFETLDQLRHPEFIARWPQSGELVRGHDNWVEIRNRYPQALEGEIEIVTGGSKMKVTQVRSPMPFGPPILTLSGGGDGFTFEGIIRYPDGKDFHAVSICEVRDGTVIKETTYFAEPFDPPDWRSDLVELEPR